MVGTPEPLKKRKRGRRDPETGLTPNEIEKWEATVMGEAVFRNEISYDLDWTTAYPDKGYKQIPPIEHVVRRLTVEEILELTVQMVDVLQQGLWRYQKHCRPGYTLVELAKLVGHSTPNIRAVLKQLNMHGYVIATPLKGFQRHYVYAYRDKQSFDLKGKSALNKKFTSYLEEMYRRTDIEPEPENGAGE